MLKLSKVYKYILLEINESCDNRAGMCACFDTLEDAIKAKKEMQAYADSTPLHLTYAVEECEYYGSFDNYYDSVITEM